MKSFNQFKRAYSQQETILHQFLIDELKSEDILAIANKFPGAIWYTVTNIQHQDCGDVIILKRETKEEMESRARTDYNRYFFNELLARLSNHAQNNDIGFYIKECAGAFVNNFTEGRELTLRERIDYLKDKMTKKRAGNESLADWFPTDWEAIKQFTREYTTE